MHFKQHYHSLALVLVPIVASQTTRVCSAETSVCFQELFDTNTGSTFGFILPLRSGKNNDTNDFLVKITTQLPYGFVGLGSSAPGSLPSFSVDALMTRFAQPGAVGTAQTAFIAQQSFLSEAESEYVPSAEKSGNATVSLSLQTSIYESGGAEFIFRCQGCSALLPQKAGDKLTLFRSTVPGIYSTPTALNATLLVKGMTISQVSVPSLDIWRSAEYASSLKALGLE